MKDDCGKYDSYSDGGLPNGPRQEPAPPRATADSERRDQLYKVWLNYNQLTGSVESRKVFDSACAILAPRGVSVASAGNALSERDAFEAWFVRQHIPDPADREEVFVDPSWANVIEDDWTVWQARAALASQSTPVAPVVEQARDATQAIKALQYWRNECTGPEPSLSVFERMVDDVLANQTDDALEWKFECFIDFATGGKLSKSSWALETLKAAVTEHITETVDAFVADALAQSTPHVPAGEPPEGEAERRMDFPSACEVAAFECGWRTALATPRAPEPAAPVAQEPVAAWINYPVKVVDNEFGGYGEPELSFKRSAYGYDLAKAEPLYRRAAAPTAAQGLDGLLDQFERAVGTRDKLHAEYMGKAMTDEVYDRFATLRDDTIPALRAAILSANRAAQETK